MQRTLNGPTSGGVVSAEIVDEATGADDAGFANTRDGPASSVASPVGIAHGDGRAGGGKGGVELRAECAVFASR